MTNYTAEQIRNLVDKHQRGGDWNYKDLLPMLRQAADDREDAERYRWLRDRASDQPVESRPPMVVIETMSGDDVEYLRCDDLDVAVDTARTPKEQTNCGCFGEIHYSCKERTK